MWCLVVWSIPSLVGAQQAEKPALTGDPATDAWVRITFGQAVDPEVLDNPVWGTKTFLALTPAQLEGARLFMQRCPARLLQLCPFPTVRRCGGHATQDTLARIPATSCRSNGTGPISPARI